MVHGNGRLLKAALTWVDARIFRCWDEPLWRGSLLPLEGEALPWIFQIDHRFATAAQSSGSKLPRHRKFHAHKSRTRPEIVQTIPNAHFRAPIPLAAPCPNLLKHLFGTLVRKLLLSIGRTRSSNNNSAPQALILVLRD